MLVSRVSDGEEVSRNRGKSRMVAWLPQGPQKAAEFERDQQVAGSPALGNHRGPYKGWFTIGYFLKLKLI